MESTQDTKHALKSTTAWVALALLIVPHIPVVGPALAAWIAENPDTAAGAVGAIALFARHVAEEDIHFWPAKRPENQPPG